MTSKVPGLASQSMSRPLEETKKEKEEMPLVDEPSCYSVWLTNDSLRLGKHYSNVHASIPQKTKAPTSQAYGIELFLLCGLDLDLPLCFFFFYTLLLFCLF